MLLNGQVKSMSCSYVCDTNKIEFSQKMTEICSKENKNHESWEF